MFKKVNKKLLIIAGVIIAIVAALAITVPAFADVHVSVKGEAGKSKITSGKYNGETTTRFEVEGVEAAFNAAKISSQPNWDKLEMSGMNQLWTAEEGGEPDGWEYGITDWESAKKDLLFCVNHRAAALDSSIELIGEEVVDLGIQSDGYHYWRLYVTPKGAAANGWNTKGMTGYQRIGAVYREQANGGCQMNKISLYDCTDNNPLYSLAGTKYNIYRDASCTDYTNVSITLDENGYGHTDSEALPSKQTYYVKEDENSHGTGYEYNSTVGTVYIDTPKSYANQVTWNSSNTTYDIPIIDPSSASVKKADAQTKEAGISEGEAWLSGANYTFDYYTSYFTKTSDISGQTANHRKYWLMQTNENGLTGIANYYKDNKIDGDDFYYDIYGNVIVPLGTIVIKEKDAPTGYNLSDITYIVNTTIDYSQPDHVLNTVYNGDTGEILTIIEDENYFKGIEQVKKGDIEFHKVDEEGKTMPYIPFKITSTTDPNEYHIVVTDANGSVNTKNNIDSTNVNVFDDYYKDGKIDESEQAAIKQFFDDKKTCRTWFCFDKKTGQYVAPDESAVGIGSFYYGKYTIEELPVAGNAGKGMISKEFEVSQDTTLVNLGTLEDKDTLGSIKISTYATNIYGMKYLDVTDTELVIDKLSYWDASKNTDYYTKSWIVDKKSGLRITDVVENSFNSGNSTEGEVSINLSVDTSKYAGRELVIYEEVWDKPSTESSAELLAEHKDLTDVMQTLYVFKPTINTKLIDTGTGTKFVERAVNTPITDTVNYTSLLAGQKYNLVSKIVNKNTKEVITEFTNEFTPAAADGAYNAQTSIDTTGFSEGDQLVAFEYLYYNGALIASEENLSNTDQTITVTVPTPAISSYAHNGEYGKDLTVSDTTKIYDIISYEGLEPNRTYVLKGSLHDASTGDPILDAQGKSIVIMNVFTPLKSSGQSTIVFTVDTISNPGTLVCYQELYDNGTLIASDCDPANESQRVYPKSPYIQTDLLSSMGTKDFTRDTHTKLVDTINYYNFDYSGNTNKSNNYRIVSEIVEKDNPGRVFSKVDQMYTITGSTGSFTVNFDFDTSNLPDSTYLVCLTTVYTEDNRQIIYHGDLNNARETVSLNNSNCATYLFEYTNHSHTAERSKNTQLIDYVYYKELSVGETYIVTGTLKDANGNDLVDSSGKTITVSQPFTPESKAGHTEVLFELDTSTMDVNTVIIAFEQIKLNDAIVARHEDISDENQQVRIVYQQVVVTTEALSLTTGEHETYAMDDEKINDQVSFIGAEVGYQWKVKGEIRDRSTGEIVTIDGKQLVNEVTFMTTETFGQIDVVFDVDTRQLLNKDLVCFEYMYDHTGMLRASHCDITDAYQTIHVTPPSFWSSMIQDGAELLNHNFTRKTDCVLVDSIYYSNVLPNREYTLNGVLMNKNTKEVYINEVTNEPVTATAKFKAADYEGVEVLYYKFDSTLIPEDTELVSFVGLNMGDIEVATGKSFDDEKETDKIETPHFNTELFYSIDSQLLKEAVVRRDLTVTDNIIYTNFPAGQVLNNITWLVDSKTGLPIHDDKITDEQAKDTIDLLIDALGGRVAVSNNYVDPETGKLVYEPQWAVFFDNPFTKIDLDKLNNIRPDYLQHLFLVENEFTVDSENTLHGVLPMSGTFNFAAIDKNIEKVTAMNVLRTKDSVIAESVELNDPREQISIKHSSITTALSDTGGNKEVKANSHVLLADKIEFKDLIVGGEYTIKSKLIRKDTQAVISEGSKTFVPETVNGDTTIGFDINTTDLGGTDLVAYEYLYLTDDLAASHEDINDTNQTIHVGNIIDKLLKGIKTGDPLDWGILVSIVGIAGVVAFIVYKKRKTPKKYTPKHA